VPLEAAWGTDFQRKIWHALRSIKSGITVSYGDLAVAAGFAKSSARAVGSAVGHNPWSIIVPCHRVISADGTLGGYAGGAARKSKLLLLEGAVVKGAGTSKALGKRKGVYSCTKFFKGAMHDELQGRIFVE